MRRRLLLLITFGILAATTWMAYRPSIGHIARADHWWYLFQTSHQDSFGGLVAHTYSYGRTVSHGDYGLFRPGLFAMLAAEKTLFGHDFAWWQRAGILLHLGNVGLLLLLLLRVQRLCGGSEPSATPARARLALACGLAFFFALNLCNIEMVIWSHINAYMLFVGLELGVMLLALDLLARDDLTGGQRLRRLIGVWVLLLIAAFTYEIGQFFALIVAGALAWKTWQGMGFRRACLVGLCFGSVLVLYQSADRLDRLAHPREHPEADYDLIVNKATPLATLDNATRYVLFTVVQPFFPSGMTYSPTKGWDQHTRLGLSEPRNTWRWGLFGEALFLLSLVAIPLLLARTGLSLRVFRPGPTRGKLLSFLALPLGLFGLHLGVTVLGRLNLRPDVLSSSTYYTYLPLLMVLIGTFSLWAAAPMGGWSSRIDLALLVPLAVLAVVGGGEIHRINTEVRDQVRLIRQEVQIVHGLVCRHTGDAHFALGLDRASEPELGVMLGIPLARILCPKVADRDDPSHVLMLEQGKPLVLPIDDFRRRYPGRTLRPPV